MAKEYIRPITSQVEVESEGQILVGSVTCHKIEVNSVEVDEFEDGGTMDITFD